MPEPRTREDLKVSADAPLPLPCICLIVLDGWGIASLGPGNAISLAHPQVFDELAGDHPHSSLSASGSSVGLP